MSEVFEDNNDGALNVNLDTTGQSEDSLHAGGGISVEGRFHVDVTDIEHIPGDDDKLSQLKIDMHVLDGNAPGQRDKIVYHRVYLESWVDSKNRSAGKTPLSKKSQEGIAMFAFAFGLISADDLGKPGVATPFHDIVGRQAIVEVKQDKPWKDNNGVAHDGGFKIPWNTAWPLEHPDVSSVPKDPDALALIGGITPSTPAVDVSDL